MTLSFAQSGSSPASFSLADVKDLAAKHGVTRADGSADLDAFFKLYGVKALSTFKAKWSTEKLLPPGNSPPAALAPDTPALGAGTTKSFEPAQALACEPLPLSEFDAKSDARHWDKALKWRLIQRPGGAFIKPDDWYRLYAAAKQATEGNNMSERPMWADHGGIDFNGRCAWDAWMELKGMPTDEAKAKFCRVYAEAHSSERFATNFHCQANTSK